MTKVHYQHGPHGNACGRASAKHSTEPHRVTCLACQKSDQFLAAKKIHDDAREAAFLAQEPKQVSEPWRRDDMMVCDCGNDTFRYRGRSCMGHYDDWVCASCAQTTSRLTETGMSF